LDASRTERGRDPIALPKPSVVLDVADRNDSFTFEKIFSIGAAAWGIARPAQLGCAGEQAPRRIKTNCEKNH
jgi:hypothetical protein